MRTKAKVVKLEYHDLTGMEHLEHDERKEDRNAHFPPGTEIEIEPAHWYGKTQVFRGYKGEYDQMEYFSDRELMIDTPGELWEFHPEAYGSREEFDEWLEDWKGKIPKPKRYPSEITKEEFIEIAKIINHNAFKRNKPELWKVKGIDNLLILSCEDSNLSFLIDVESNDIEILCQSAHKCDFPGFQQSLKIAQYLDSIGVEYRAQNEEQ